MSQQLNDAWIAAIPLAYKAARSIARNHSMDVEDLAQELLCRFPEVADAENLYYAFYDMANRIKQVYDPLGIGLRGTRSQLGGYPHYQHYARILDEVMNTQMLDQRLTGECDWCGKFIEGPSNTCSIGCRAKFRRHTAPEIRKSVVTVLARLREGEQPGVALRLISGRYRTCIHVLRRLGYDIVRRKGKEKGVRNLTFFRLAEEGIPLPV